VQGRDGVSEDHATRSYGRMRNEEYYGHDYSNSEYYGIRTFVKCLKMNAMRTPRAWTGGGKPPHPPWMRCARPFWMRDVTRKRILRDTYICQVFENECDASTTSMDGWAWTAISS
jgi:hypothetical protein